MSASDPRSAAVDAGDTVVTCAGDCGDAYQIRDMHVVTVRYPESEAQLSRTSKFTEAVCENCMRRAANAAGLAYRDPDDPPQPVRRGGSDGGA